MNKVLLGITAGCLLLAAAPAASAADLSGLNVSNPAAPPPVSAAPTTTIAFEASPEFKWLSPYGLADSYYKASLSHTFAGAWVVGASFQDTFKPNDQYQYYAEASIGYKIKLAPTFTLTPSVGLGDSWGDTGFGGDGEDSFGYYALYLAGDWKLSSHWTWNMFNLRYRNAFDYDWETPKVATGVTYAINANNAVYTNVGFAWKNSVEDKINWAVGYKYSF